MNTTAAAGSANTTGRLISFNDARDFVGFKSRTSLYTAIKTDPTFPVPIRRGRGVFFLENEVMAYIANLAATRRAA